MSEKKLKILKLLKLRSKKDLSEHSRAMSAVNAKISELETLKVSLTKQLEHYGDRKNISSVSQLRSNGVFTQKLNVEIERIEQQNEHLMVEVQRLAVELMRLDAKKQKIEDIALLLQASLAAHQKVALKMNAPRAKLGEITALLPSLHAPTVSDLADTDWVALETVVDRDQVRSLIPDLRKRGAEGILEYELRKII